MFIFSIVARFWRNTVRASIIAGMLALLLTACSHNQREASQTDGPVPRDAYGNPVLTNFEH